MYRSHVMDQWTRATSVPRGVKFMGLHHSRNIKQLWIDKICKGKVPGSFRNSCWSQRSRSTDACGQHASDRPSPATLYKPREPRWLQNVSAHVLCALHSCRIRPGNAVWGWYSLVASPSWRAKLDLVHPRLCLLSTWLSIPSRNAGVSKKGFQEYV